MRPRLHPLRLALLLALPAVATAQQGPDAPAPVQLQPVTVTASPLG